MMRINRRLTPLILGFLVVGVGIFAFIENTPILASNESPSAETHSPQEKPLARTPIISRSVSQTKLSPVEKFVETESKRIGHVDDDPDKSYLRLKRVAKNLKSLDFIALSRAAVNPAVENDQRFLGVYLMTLSDDAAVVSPLMSVALAPLQTTDPESRVYSDELILRIQALEGIAKFDKTKALLKDYLSRQENSFLADQARRLIRGRN